MDPCIAGPGDVRGGLARSERCGISNGEVRLGIEDATMAADALRSAEVPTSPPVSAARTIPRKTAKNGPITKRGVSGSRTLRVTSSPVRAPTDEFLPCLSDSD